MARSLTNPLPSIAVVIVYFGPWPQWFPFFLESCRHNPTVDFLIFSDAKGPAGTPANVKIIASSVQEFEKLASNSLKLNVSIRLVYKICDLKPAFGLIFEKYLANYSFWAHSDLDVIFGDIRKFLTARVLSGYDLICPRKEYIAGHFTLYRNTRKLNTLFKKSADYKKVFSSPDKVFSFDECNHLWRPLLLGLPIQRLDSEIISMTHVVLYARDVNYVRILMKTMVAEQDKVSKRGNFLPFTKKLLWKNGQITSVDGRRSHMYFHFHLLKKHDDFSIPAWKDAPAGYIMSAKGFSSVDD